MNRDLAVMLVLQTKVCGETFSKGFPYPILAYHLAIYPNRYSTQISRSTIIFRMLQPASSHFNYS